MDVLKKAESRNSKKNKRDKSKQYVHIGEDVNILAGEILGIFDIERVTVVQGVNDYLGKVQKSGGIFYVSLDMPKSFAVCSDKVYVTNVSAATIKKRVKELS